MAPGRFITRGISIAAFISMLASPTHAKEMGVASYYGAGEPLESRTAMNLPFDSRLMECASWYYPLGSVLEVTNLRTRRSVVVRCTDRGPARRLNRLIDLTAQAFATIEDPQCGLAVVEVKRLS